MGNGEERARGLKRGRGSVLVFVLVFVLVLFLFRARRDPIERLGLRELRASVRALSCLAAKILRGNASQFAIAPNLKCTLGVVQFRSRTYAGKEAGETAESTGEVGVHVGGHVGA
jgi:hypothetical protein